MLDALENRTVSYTRTLADPVRDLAVAVPEDDFVWRDTHTGIAMAVRGAIDLFEDMGMTIRAASLPGMEAATRAGGLMSIAEGAAYHEERMRSAPERFGGDVRSRLELGLSYSAVDYSRARATGRAWRSEVDGLFRDGADLIALPVTPILPPPVKGTDSASVTRVLLKFTYAFSLSAMPSLSLPCGFTPDGLPVGVQLIAPSTELLLRVAHAYQGVTSWHTRRPDAPDSAKSASDLQSEKDPGNE
jgi:Asp-tRNA(Asn)/Glu-tRNA(Gln) amidotransferase A subunit family amidase